MEATQHSLVDEGIKAKWAIDMILPKKGRDSDTGSTWMNLEDMLSDVSQSQKDEYCVIPLLRGT